MHLLNIVDRVKVLKINRSDWCLVLFWAFTLFTLRFLSSRFPFQSFSLPEKVKEKGFPVQSGAIIQRISLRYPNNPKSSNPESLIYPDPSGFVFRIVPQPSRISPSLVERGRGRGAFNPVRGDMFVATGFNPW